MDNKETSFKKKTNLNSLFARLLFVVLAFVLMIVSSCVYVSNMMHDHLSKESLNTLTQAKMKVETDIILAETLLVRLAEDVDRIIEQGGGEHEIQEFMVQYKEEIENDEPRHGIHFTNVRGYFDVFDGAYFDGDRWEPPPGYESKERPWYIAAVEANGEVGIVPVYKTIYSDVYDMSYSISIFDDTGQQRFVLALNVPLYSINYYATDMRITKNSYGILVSGDQLIIAHPDQDLIGYELRDVNTTLSEFVSEIQKGTALPEREMVNNSGEKTVVFTSVLDSGWVLSVVIPQSEYYQELYMMILIISVIGAVLALILCIIFIRIEKAKNKADEKARQQDALLKSMEKIRETDERTQLMLDATPVGCKLWSRDFEMLACNEECVRVFGVADKDEFMNNWVKLSPEVQPNGRLTKELFKELINEAFDKGFLRSEWMHQKINGDMMPVEVTLVRVAYRDDFAVAGYIRDLTEYHQMLDEISKTEDELRDARDSAENANQAKSSFLANMSHEMRTPLNVVVGLTDLHIDEEELPDNIMNDLKKINSAGDTLLSIVNDVLDISKIEAGRLELNPIQYNTASLFNDIITLNIIRIDSKPIIFNIDIDEEIPSDILGDELRLKQVFNNLLSNSFKYTHEGKVTLKVSCERDGEKDLWMNISVKDTGVGIKKEDLEKLFTEYNQVDTRANRMIEGTGLGLSITKKLVELMGGSITVESEYGKGTTFFVKVKQEYVESKPLGREIVDNLKSFRYTETKQHVSQKIVRVDMSYARVLVVDDFQINLDVTAGLIQKYKIQVDGVTSGQEAIDRIKQGKPKYDAIFMDHMMPGMDGIEATRLIRAIDSEYSNSVPIISLTANAISGNEQMFLDSGFQAFLSKPINIMKLDAILREWVRDKSREVSATTEPEPEGGGFVVKIHGIDGAKGLDVYGNDIELYISVLRSYTTNTPAVIKTLRDVNEDNLASYAIGVHGLKGAAANIGATINSKEALAIETLAKAGDLTAVQTKNKVFLDNTEALVVGIKAWLDENDRGRMKPRLSAPAPEMLASLKKYCEQFDMNMVDKTMEALESFSYEENGDLVEWLRERIDISDFGAIVERL